MQVACLLHTNKTLNFVDVHKQTGCNDCGLFSIAYAVLLCLGESPDTLVFGHPIRCVAISHLVFTTMFFYVTNQRQKKKNLKIK